MSNQNPRILEILWDIMMMVWMLCGITLVPTITVFVIYLMARSSFLG